MRIKISSCLRLSRKKSLSSICCQTFLRWHLLKNSSPNSGKKETQGTKRGLQLTTKPYRRTQEELLKKLRISLIKIPYLMQLKIMRKSTSVMTWVGHWIFTPARNSRTCQGSRSHSSPQSSSEKRPSTDWGTPVLCRPTNSWTTPKSCS